MRIFVDLVKVGLLILLEVNKESFSCLFMAHFISGEILDLSENQPKWSKNAQLDNSVYLGGFISMSEEILC